MKSKFMIMLGAMLLTLASCGSNDDPKPDNGSVDNADIDYNEKNAASWGNYMVQVASLLRTDADNLYKAWTEKYENGEPFAETFRKHDDASYPSVRSCVEELVDYCANIANEVGTAKIGEPYNLHVAGNTTEAVYAVESWYSWHSREDYNNNIHSIRNSYFGSLDGTVSPNSLSALVASEDADFDSKVKEAISKASASILAIPQPFRNNIGSDESVAAMEACADLEQILSKQLKNRISGFSEQALQRVVDNYVDNVIIPTYRDLRDRNQALYDAVAAFRSAPSDDAFASACSAWLSAREPWERSEAFLFGPVDALGLDPNMDSWPLDQNAIVQILNSGNYDDLDWTDADGDDKIEAVQSVRGFHTLEFLLFKNGRPRTVGN